VVAVDRRGLCLQAESYYEIEEMAYNFFKKFKEFMIANGPSETEPSSLFADFISPGFNTGRAAFQKFSMEILERSVPPTLRKVVHGKDTLKFEYPRFVARGIEGE
jgi:hypothetical protein